MGLETAPQRAVSVPQGPLVTPADPNVLRDAGQNVGQAFRTGFITASEIVDKLSERTRQKEKMEIDLAKLGQMQAAEAMTPEAQALRQQLQQAELAKATAAQALVSPLAQQVQEQRLLAEQAKLASFLSPEAGQARQLEAQLGLTKGEFELADAQSLGAVKRFATLAPLFIGLDIPKTADGKPDFERMKKLLPQMEENARIMETAKAQLVPGKEISKEVRKDPNDPNSVTDTFWIQGNQFGVPKTPQMIEKHTKDFQNAQNAFNFQPGTATTPAPPPPPVEVTPSQSVAAFPGLLAAAATNPMLGPVAATAISAQPAQAGPSIVDNVVPGGFTSDGWRLEKSTPPVHKSTAKQDEGKIAVARMVEADAVHEQLKQEGYQPSSWGTYVQNLLVGPLRFFRSEQNKSWNSAQEAWLQGLLRLESGAAISKKEEGWYRDTFFPILGDTPKVEAQKEGLRSAIAGVVGRIATGQPEQVKLGNAQLAGIRNQAVAANFPRSKPPMAGAVASTTQTGSDGLNYNIWVDNSGGKHYQRIQ